MLIYTEQEGNTNRPFPIMPLKGQRLLILLREHTKPPQWVNGNRLNLELL